MKFKVGDKVEVICEGMGRYGETGEVSRVVKDCGFPYYIKFDDQLEYRYHEHELKLIEKGEQKMFKIGDKVKKKDVPWGTFPTIGVTRDIRVLLPDIPTIMEVSSEDNLKFKECQMGYWYNPQYFELIENNVQNVNKESTQDEQKMFKIGDKVEVINKLLCTYGEVGEITFCENQRLFTYNEDGEIVPSSDKNMICYKVKLKNGCAWYNGNSLKFSGNSLKLIENNDTNSTQDNQCPKKENNMNILENLSYDELLVLQQKIEETIKNIFAKPNDKFTFLNPFEICDENWSEGVNFVFRKNNERHSSIKKSLLKHINKTFTYVSKDSEKGFHQLMIDGTTYPIPEIFLKKCSNESTQNEEKYDLICISDGHVGSKYFKGDKGILLEEESTTDWNPEKFYGKIKRISDGKILTNTFKSNWQKV